MLNGLVDLFTTFKMDWCNLGKKMLVLGNFQGIKTPHIT